MIRLPCKKCGRLTAYELCDNCWLHTLSQTVDRHAEAIAKREQSDGC